MFNREQKRARAHGSGFTLTEVLVVIAIIGLLAVLLFPVMARARERAHGTTCLSNERQLCQGILMYAQDHDEHLPVAGWNVTATVPGSRWYLDIQPYTRSSALSFCPSNPHLAVENSHRQAGIGSDYGINTRLSQWAGSDGLWFPGAGKAIAEISKPANIVLLCDAGQLREELPDEPEDRDPETWMRYLEGTTDCQAVGPPYPTVPYGLRDVELRRPLPVHNGGPNVGFADGHVKWMRNDALIGPMPNGWPTGDVRNLWNN